MAAATAGIQGIRAAGSERLKKIWPELWLLVKGRRRYLALGLLLMLISRAAAVVLPLSSRFLIDDVIGKHNLWLLLPLTGVVISAILVQALSDYTLTQVLSTEAFGLILELRRKVQAHILRLPLAYYDKNQSGMLVSRIMNDVEGLRNLLGTSLIQFLGGIVAAVIALWIMLKLSLVITLVVVISLAAYSIQMQFRLRTIRPVFRDRSKITAEVTGRLTEALGAARIVKGYHAEQREEQVFAAGVQRLFQNALKSTGFSSNMGLTSALFFGALSIFIMYSGTRQILGGAMTLGGFVTYTMFLGQLTGPLMQLVSLGTQLNEAIAGFERTREVLSENREEQDPERTVALENIRGAIVFEGVNFAYTPEKTVLHDICFSSHPGSVTALVGPSGAGKSTIMGLIAAFYKPTSGTIYVDSVDLSSIRLDSYRVQLGLVLQENFLFDGTIRENVAFSRPDATDEEISAACCLAHVDEFVETFPDGYRTIVGERGVKLSGGQRQRISIARAILADPRVLLLDEATSSLDSESEAMIQEGLGYLMRSRTTFVIAHRLSTIRNADQILVLDKGRIVERGTHESLYQMGGKYQALYDKQYGMGLDFFEELERSLQEDEATVKVREQMSLSAHAEAASNGSRGTHTRGPGARFAESVSILERPRTEANTIVPVNPEEKPRLSELIARNLFSSIASLLCIAIVAAIGIFMQLPPKPALGDAAPANFSAVRAIKHVEAIAAKPHPIGTEEHARVQQYIVQELRSMGMTPEVQTAHVIYQDPNGSVTGAVVQNVIARIPGTHPDKAVLAVAHYDSVPNAFGAADDSAGVAAILEAIRAIQAGAPLKRDLIALFTDGEEVGLLGSRAFMEQHRWARDVGFVVNLDARGTNGPALMFETSEGNGSLIKEISRNSSLPVTSSLMNEAYKYLPNDTDLTTFKRFHLAGVNLAFIDNAAFYHTAGDDLYHLDPKSLQDQGNAALGIIRSFGNADEIKARETDAIYFDSIGRILVHYPRSWAVPLSGVMLLWFGVVCAWKKHIGEIALTGILAGMAATLISGTVSWLAVTGGLALLHEKWASGLYLSYTRDAYNLAFIALTIAVCSVVYAAFRKFAGSMNLFMGALLAWAALALTSSIYAPGASYFFVWPLCLLLVGISADMPTKTRLKIRGHDLTYAALACIPAAFIVVPLLYVILVGVGLGMSAIVMILVALVSVPLIAQLELAGNKSALTLAAVAVILAAGIALRATTETHTTRKHPGVDSIFYLSDARSGRATWVSMDRKPDSWTEQFLSTSPQLALLDNYPPAPRRKFLHTDAPVTNIVPPVVELLEDSKAGAIRTIRLRLKSPRKASVVTFYLEGEATIAEVNVDNRQSISLARTGADQGPQWKMDYYNIPDAGVIVTVKLSTTGSLRAVVLDRSYGLPELPGMSFKPRAENLMPVSSAFTDTTQAINEFSF